MDQYIGCSTALELGYALALQKPIYATEPIFDLQAGFEDSCILSLLQETANTMSIKQVVLIFLEILPARYNFHFSNSRNNYWTMYKFIYTYFY